MEKNLAFACSQRKEHTMTTAKTTRIRARNAFLAIAAAALVLAAFALASVNVRAATVSKVPVSEQVALDWNVNPGNAVRAATALHGVPPASPPPPFYQTNDLLYMPYVPATISH